ncbi:hypothetical protein GE061_008618 [Apolygus lucorum]|uniref:Uncharacterized protein n=1 Tax=Apolygus lucorum TaxID=248454 RepID=A0A8S9WKJ6_APOLU|nr:hypothetical protein GE061_008618 [Apolygus lucorum]
MEDGIAVKEEPMSEGDEDQEMEVEIKQEMLIWDEYVKEEVGNSWTDEDAGCPMIKQEDSSAADPLCDESDVLQGSTGEQRSEAGPAQDQPRPPRRVHFDTPVARPITTRSHGVDIPTDMSSQGIDTPVDTPIDTSQQGIDTPIDSPIDTSPQGTDTPLDTMSQQGIDTFDTSIDTSSQQGTDTIDTPDDTLSQQGIDTIDTPDDTLSQQGIDTIDTPVGTLSQALRRRTIATTVHTIATKIHTIATKIHTIATKIHTIAMTSHTIATAIDTITKKTSTTLLPLTQNRKKRSSRMQRMTHHANA